ncbi:MAG: hypothetical protein WC483_00150 [Candidatus Paceibacterota bacterium]
MASLGERLLRGVYGITPQSRQHGSIGMTEAPLTTTTAANYQPWYMSNPAYRPSTNLPPIRSRDGGIASPFEREAAASSPTAPSLCGGVTVVTAASPPSVDSFWNATTIIIILLIITSIIVIGAMAYKFSSLVAALIEVAKKAQGVST